MYISIIHTNCFNAFTGIQATIIYPTTVPKSNSLSFGKEEHDNQGCCVQGYKNHSCNTNEGCSYQGQNNQGLLFTGIAIYSRDVLFKDRFMLAPNCGWRGGWGDCGVSANEYSCAPLLIKPKETLQLKQQ